MELQPSIFVIKALSLSPSTGQGSSSQECCEMVAVGAVGWLRDLLLGESQFCTSSLAQLKDASSFYTPMKSHSIFQFLKGSNACLQKATVTFDPRTHLC